MSHLVGGAVLHELIFEGPPRLVGFGKVGPPFGAVSAQSRVRRRSSEAESPTYPNKMESAGLAQPGRAGGMSTARSAWALAALQESDREPRSGPSKIARRRSFLSRSTRHFVRSAPDLAKKWSWTAGVDPTGSLGTSGFGSIANMAGEFTHHRACTAAERPIPRDIPGDRRRPRATAPDKLQLSVVKDPCRNTHTQHAPIG